MNLRCNTLSTDIKQEIIRFTEGVEDRLGFREFRVFLFGSYAFNKSHIWSDIDVAVVSNWGNADFVGQMAVLLDIIKSRQVY